MQNTFLKFEEVDDGKKRKTKLFAVVGLQGLVLLGEIKWFARWRRYAFNPEADSVFDAACLQEITAFIDGLMQARGVWRK